MKAKHFKKLRTQMVPFLVLETYGLFGDFKSYLGELKGIEYYTEVMARNAREAANRFAKRKNIGDFRGNQTMEKFALIKVLPKHLPFARHASYYK